MYRKVAVLSLPALLLVGCAGPQVDRDAELARIEARGDALVAAETAQDIDAAMQFWGADAIVQPPGSPQIQGKDAIRALYGQFFTPAVKEFGSTRAEIDLAESGDMAVEYGVNRMVLTGPEGDALDMGKYLAIWRQLDGEWYVVALSYSSDAPAPAPMGQ